MDQKTLDEVIRSAQLCIYEHLESLPERVHKSLIGNNMLPDTLSLSLGEQDSVPIANKQDEWVSG